MTMSQAIRNAKVESVEGPGLPPSQHLMFHGKNTFTQREILDGER